MKSLKDLTVETLMRLRGDAMSLAISQERSGEDYDTRFAEYNAINEEVIQRIEATYEDRRISQKLGPEKFLIVPYSCGEHLYEIDYETRRILYVQSVHASQLDVDHEHKLTIADLAFQPSDELDAATTGTR